MFFKATDSSLRAAGYILAWYATNVTTVILNKYIFKFLEFTFPITLTAIHMMICSLGAYATIFGFKLVKLHHIESSTRYRRIVPLALLFVSNIVLGNVSIRWVNVSFMQTVKSSVPVFTVLMQVLFLGKSFSGRIYLSLIPAVGGVMLASMTESEFDATGFWAALIASIITAGITVVSGLILGEKMDSINLVYYMAPLSFALLLPVAFFKEGELLMEWWQLSTFYEQSVLILSGIIAFLLNVTTFLVIANTSALTSNIAGNFKVILSIILSVLIFKNKISFINGVGIAAAIGGVAYYNYVKQTENQVSPKGNG